MKTIIQIDQRLDVTALHHRGVLASTPQKWTLHAAAFAHEAEASSNQQGIEFAWPDRIEYIQVLWTACNYGGRRPWLQCPAPNCKRKVAQVYFSSEVACRRCLGLTYPCQRERAELRTLRKLDKIRARLGWSEDDAAYARRRPKGMHRRTYERLVRRHDALAAVVEDLAAAFAAMLPPMTGELAEPCPGFTDPSIATVEGVALPGEMWDALDVAPRSHDIVLETNDEMLPAIEETWFGDLSYPDG